MEQKQDPPYFEPLPVPSAKEVEAFRVLYAEHFCVQLDFEEALDLATRYLHLFIIFNS